MKITSQLLCVFSALSLQSISICAAPTAHQNIPFFIPDDMEHPELHDFLSPKETKESSTKITHTPSFIPQEPSSEKPNRKKKKDFFHFKDKKEHPKELKHRVQIGADYTNVTIKPREHQSFNGNMGGLQAMYEYRPVNRFYGAGKLSWKEGTAYNKIGKRALDYIDVQERLGYTFGFDHGNTQISLFSGFGYRHLGHKFTPKEGSPVHFRYNEFYFPVGWVTTFAINSWFSFGMDLTWMPQIFPTVGIVPLKGARWDIKCSLANFAVELPVNFTLTQNKRFMLTLKPFYEYWKDGHSTAKASTGSSLGIPSNTYDFWGVDVNFAYSF